MAAHAAAALLDELMGRDRNLQPTEKRSELKWDDPEVCISKFVFIANYRSKCS